jgi:hypothetical protein
VNCSTPYPAITRECIKQIIDTVKSDFPDNFIRVVVDINNMVFKVARKPPKDAKDNAWKYGKVDIPIPKEALDISCRRAPKDFKIVIPDLNPQPTPLVTAPPSPPPPSEGEKAKKKGSKSSGSGTSQRRSSSISSMEDEI